MPFVDFRQVKASVSIEAVLDHYGLTTTLKRRGESLRGKCPIHKGDNITSFSVDTGKNCFRCFACGSSGNILDLVSGIESVGIRDAALQIQQWAGLSRQHQARPTKRAEDTPKQIESPVEPQANKPLTFELSNLDQRHPYLTERGLTAETIATFGLGYCAKGIMAGRIVIPIHNAAGDLVAYAGRWPGEPPEGEGKYKLPTAKHFTKELELFNLSRAMESNALGLMPFIVVEGFFDCMKLWQAGYRRTVALMGNSLSEKQASLIVKTVGHKGRVLLFFDEDDAGRQGREKALARLAPHCYVRVIEFPEEGIQPENFHPQRFKSLI